MAIPINTLINITDNVISSATTAGSLSGLILTNNNLIPTSVGSNVIQCNNLAAVGVAFGINSAEYAAATVYFKGFQGATKSPDYLLFGGFQTAATPGIVTGAAITDNLAAFQAITAGTLTFNIAGNAVNLTAINLAAATSFANVASLIQTKLQANAGTSTATFTFNGTTQKFILNTTLTGATQTVTFANNTPLALLLKMTSTDGGQLSQGNAVLTPAQVMENIVATNANWFSFTTLFSTDGSPYSVATALAAWANSKGTLYAYYPWTLEAAAYDTTSTTDLKALIAPLNYSCVSLNYGSVNISVFAMAIRACIDYNINNSTASDAYKSQSGLGPSVTDPTQAAALITKKINYYGAYSTKAESFNIYYQGAVDGEYLFIDNYANQVWFADQLTIALAALFRTAVRIPNNDTGNEQIRTTIQEIITKALVNGVVQIGNTNFSGEERAVLIQQAGLDITSLLTTQGYYIKITTASASDRAARIGPAIGLWYTNGQAVHRINLNTTLVV